MYCGPEHGVSWWMFHGSWEKHIRLFDGEIGWCLLCPVDWRYCWVQLCPHWVFQCWICPFLNKGCWRPNYGGGSIYFSLHLYQFLPHNVWHSVVRCTHIQIVVSSRRIDQFITTSCPSSSLITFLALKSALSEINIATLIWLWLTLAWYIYISIHLLLIYMCLYI